MNDMNDKLLKIKKSCKAGRLVANILCIIVIVGCVLSMVAGIFITARADTLETKFEQYVEDNSLNPGENRIASVRMFSFDTPDPDKWESDVPAIQKALDEHPYTFLYGMYLFMAAGILAVVAVLLKLINGTFLLIEKEENPFTDKVIKRVTIVLGIISALLFMTSGAALGILGALITWVVYTVLDYGKTLQIQADETL